MTGTPFGVGSSRNGQASVSGDGAVATTRLPGSGWLPAGWRRWRADEASGFSLQLFAALAALIVLVGGSGYLLIGRELDRSQLRADTAAAQADAQGFEVLGDHATSTRDGLHDIGVILVAIGRRPGTHTAVLVDQGHIVRAASQHRLVGTSDGDPRIRAVLLRGAGFFGNDIGSEQGQRNLQFVVPVIFRGSRYAYELEFNHVAFDEQVAGARTALILGGLAALLLGSGVFYLVGGKEADQKPPLCAATRDARRADRTAEPARLPRRLPAGRRCRLEAPGSTRLGRHRPRRFQAHE